MGRMAPLVLRAPRVCKGPRVRTGCLARPVFRACPLLLRRRRRSPGRRVQLALRVLGGRKVPRARMGRRVSLRSLLLPESLECLVHQACAASAASAALLDFGAQPAPTAWPVRPDSMGSMVRRASTDVMVAMAPTALQVRTGSRGSTAATARMESTAAMDRTECLVRTVRREFQEATVSLGKMDSRERMVLRVQTAQTARTARAASQERTDGTACRA